MSERDDFTGRDPWLEQMRAAFRGGWVARSQGEPLDGHEEAFARWLKAEREQMDIAWLNLPVRLYNAFRRHNILTVAEARRALATVPDNELGFTHALDMRNIGWTMVEKGRIALDEYDAR